MRHPSLMFCGYSTVVVLQLPKLATRVRFPLPAVSACPALWLMVLATVGCSHSRHALRQATPPRPTVAGSSYRVQPGETLWRIGHDFGVDVQPLAQAKRLADPAELTPGQSLFVPAPPASHRFLWPVRGRVQPAQPSAGGPDGFALNIAAEPDTVVRAARTGRAAVATNRLGSLGRTLILDHGDGYVTVYGRLRQLWVQPGAEIAQGYAIGQLGRTPLYFEIRFGRHVQHPLRLLP